MRIFLYVYDDQSALEGYSVRVVKDGVEQPVSEQSFGPSGGFTWPVADPRQRAQNLKVEFPGIAAAGVWEIQLVQNGTVAGPPVTSTGGAPPSERHNWRSSMDAKRSLGQRWDAYKPTKGLMFMGVIAGAIAATAVGFGWGGWVTGGTARSMVDNASVSARSELVAAICVDRFKAGTDMAAQLVALPCASARARGAAQQSTKPSAATLW